MTAAKVQLGTRTANLRALHPREQAVWRPSSVNCFIRKMTNFQELIVTPGVKEREGCTKKSLPGWTSFPKYGQIFLIMSLKHRKMKPEITAQQRRDECEEGSCVFSLSVTVTVTQSYTTRTEVLIFKLNPPLKLWKHSVWVQTVAPEW